MRYIIIVAIAIILMGCSDPRAVPTLTKCSSGYNPHYVSTRNKVEFKCVKNED